MLELHTQGNAVVSINIPEQKAAEKEGAPAHIYKRSGDYTITGHGDYLVVKKKEHLISRVHMYREVLDAHVLVRKGIASLYLVGDTWIEKITGRELKKERSLPDPVIATAAYGALLLVLNRRRLLVLSHRLKVVGSTKLRIRYPEHLCIEESERLLALASSTERKAYIFTTTGMSVAVIDTKGRIEACDFLVTETAVYFCVALGARIKAYAIQKRDALEKSPISQDNHCPSLENSISTDQENIHPSKIGPAMEPLMEEPAEKKQKQAEVGTAGKKEKSRTVEVIANPEMEIDTDHLEKITQLLGSRKEGRIYSLSKDGVVCSWGPGEPEAAAVYVEAEGARKLFWAQEEQKREGDSGN